MQKLESFFNYISLLLLYFQCRNIFRNCDPNFIKQEKNCLKKNLTNNWTANLLHYSLFLIIVCSNPKVKPYSSSFNKTVLSLISHVIHIGRSTQKLLQCSQPHCSSFLCYNQSGHRELFLQNKYNPHAMKNVRINQHLPYGAVWWLKDKYTAQQTNKIKKLKRKNCVHDKAPQIIICCMGFKRNTPAI